MLLLLFGFFLFFGSSVAQFTGFCAGANQRCGDQAKCCPNMGLSCTSGLCRSVTGEDANNCAILGTACTDTVQCCKGLSCNPSSFEKVSRCTFSGPISSPTPLGSLPPSRSGSCQPQEKGACSAELPCCIGLTCVKISDAVFSTNFVCAQTADVDPSLTPRPTPPTPPTVFDANVPTSSPVGTPRPTQPPTILQGTPRPTGQQSQPTPMPVVQQPTTLQCHWADQAACARYCTANSFDRVKSFSLAPCSCNCDFDDGKNNLNGANGSGGNDPTQTSSEGPSPLIYGIAACAVALFLCLVVLGIGLLTRGRSQSSGPPTSSAVALSSGSGSKSSLHGGSQHHRRSATYASRRQSRNLSRRPSRQQGLHGRHSTYDAVPSEPVTVMLPPPASKQLSTYQQTPAPTSSQFGGQLQYQQTGQLRRPQYQSPGY